jgi:hypothetical protein
MDIQYFNTDKRRRAKPQAAAPKAQPLRFEDVALTDERSHNAAFALDPALDSFGDQRFELVPGVLCCPTEDGGMVLERGRS